MSAILRKADFTPLLNGHFFARVGTERIELELIEIDDHSSEQLENFSLLFRGPLPRPFAQGTYPLTHPELGEVFIFLVPVARAEDGMRYEAVFNLVLDQ